MFLSPEQIRDFAHVRESADIYSAAVCIYWMFAGVTPNRFTIKSTKKPTAAEIVREIQDGARIPIVDACRGRYDLKNDSKAHTKTQIAGLLNSLVVADIDTRKSYRAGPLASVLGNHIIQELKTRHALTARGR